MTTGAHCGGCPLQIIGSGFMPTYDGPGRKGVLLVGEALGEKEALRGKPFQGASGLQLEQMLQRAELTRNDFWIENVLHCRPPGKLRGASYEEAAILQCEPYLRKSIETLQPKVAVALGAVALRRLLELPADDCVLEHRTRGRRGYVEWSQRYQCWVVGTYHPTDLLKGQWNKTAAFLADIQLAVKIAAEGFAYRPPTVLVDPPPEVFARLIDEDYIPRAADLMLATDMETAEKRILAEDELDFSAPGIIERVSLSWKEGWGVSVPWTAPYINAIKRAHAAPGVKLIWNRAFDKPRYEAAGAPFNGPVYDMMYGWHVLHSTLPMAINYVAPFLIPWYPRWKFRNASDPGEYSAYDSAGLHDLAIGIIAGLHERGLWEAFERQTHMITDCTEAMTAPGIPIDAEARITAAKDLAAQQDDALKRMQIIIPPSMLKFDPKEGFVRQPAVLDGLVTLPVTVAVTICSACGKEDVTKTEHTSKKTLGPKVKGVISEPNPCHGATITKELRARIRYARSVPFSPSNVQLQAYQAFMNHLPVLNEDKNPTFDKDATRILIKRYSLDPLYPLLRDYRKPEKMLGYTGRWNEELQIIEGGWPTRADGRLYPVFGHTPYTGRLSAKSPNLTQIPRADDDEEEAAAVRALFIPEPGCVLVETDYAAIEAVLVGYFAGDQTFHRLATLGIHDYLNGHILRERGKIAEAPDIKWSDADLKLCFAEFKARFANERNTSKRVVYLSLYGGTPYRMYQAYPDEFGSLSNAKHLQEAFFQLFPLVRRWQNNTVELAASQGYLRGTWGHVVRFWKIYEWVKTKDGRWERKWGPDAKAAIAFVAQHAASGILKETVLRLRANHPDVFARMRLLIHDSILGQPRKSELDHYIETVVNEAEQPIPRLELPWAPGEHLVVKADVKVCLTNWAEPLKLKDAKERLV